MLASDELNNGVIDRINSSRPFMIHVSGRALSDRHSGHEDSSLNHRSTHDEQPIMLRQHLPNITGSLNGDE